MYGRKRKGITYLTCDYGRTYGREAAEAIDGHGQWLSVREDVLLPAVERFFADRIFGPMRLDKLAQQIRAHERGQGRRSDAAHRSLQKEIAVLDDRIARLIDALERGMEPDIIGGRLAKLRETKEKAEIELRGVAVAPTDQKPDDAAALLARLPDLTDALRAAPASVKRQVFDAFNLDVRYDHTRRHVTLNATISEQLAEALKDSPRVGVGPIVAPSRSTPWVEIRHVTRRGAGT